MMREVLTRRFKRLMNEQPRNNLHPHPELPTGVADPCEQNGESLPGFGEGGPRPRPRAGWGEAAPNLPAMSVAGLQPHPTGAARRPPSPRSRGGDSASHQVSWPSGGADLGEAGAPLHLSPEGRECPRLDRGSDRAWARSGSGAAAASARSAGSPLTRNGR